MLAIRSAWWRRITRWFLYKFQEKTRGFSDKDLWNLDITIAEFILPRLIAFKEYSHGVPCNFGTDEQWRACIDKMIFSFQYVVENKMFTDIESSPAYEEGINLFCKHFNDLWD